MASNDIEPNSRISWPTIQWAEANPQEMGMQEELLRQADETIRRDLPNVHSLLVIRNSTILFEQYYQGHDATSLFNVCSVTKSFISTLIGIAISEKRVASLDQKIIAFFPEYETPDIGPRKAAMTIRDLLMMKSGFAWDEEDDSLRLYSSSNWIKFMFSLPMSDDPGSSFQYNSGASHILSALIRKFTSLTALEYAQKRLFSALGIETFRWPADPTGVSLGFTGLSLTARDLAKIGLLYLNDGMWNGRQILAPEYVRAATTSWSSGGFPEEAEYGYQWWVLPSASHPAYFAAGYGGQYLWVVPELDLIAVTTAEYQLPVSLIQDHAFLITDFVVPSVIQNNSH